MSSFADHPLWQLTLVRFREFIREPEALFWVFIFPVILAAGLGVAFRNRPPEVLQIVTVNEQLAASLRQEKLLGVRQMSPAAAEQELRTGKAALLVENDDPFTLYQTAQAYSGLKNEPMANLATAELWYNVGDMRKAIVFATRARGKLSQGGVDWQRANDILGAAASQVQDQRRG